MPPRRPIDATTAGRALAAQNQRVQHACIMCGKAFVGRTQALYCGNTCSVTAYRQRRRGQRDALGRPSVAGDAEAEA